MWYRQWITERPLDGALLKVVRAQEHIDALKSGIRIYLDEKPYKIVSEQDGSTWTIGPVTVVSPPGRLSMIVGDCLNNCRAALDYVIWQLALKYFDGPPIIVDEDRRWVSFPLYRNASDLGYIHKIDRFTNRKIPTLAIDEIRAVQPYNAGYEPLWTLHELVNFDKHRSPILTIGHIASGTLDVVKEIHGTFTQMGSTHKVGGSDILRFTDSSFIAGKTSEGNQMHVNCELTIYVALQDVTMPREPLDRTLENIVKTVAHIIPRFGTFFWR